MAILIFILLTLLQVHAAPFEAWSCFSQVKKLAQEWKSTEVWDKHYLSGLSETFYASPTDHIGQWVLIKQINKGVAVAKAEQAGRLEVSFEAPDCKPKVKSFGRSTISQNFFTDKNLIDHIKKNGSGVIYHWSPQMNLSQDGLAEIKKAASQYKLALLILLSKDISEKEYQKLKTEFGSMVTQRVDSFEFKMRNMDQHFPAVLTFKNGLINPRIKYGFEKSAGYLDYIRDSMGK